MPRRRNDEIRVHVVDYRRGSLYMRYRDPVTGRQSARTTGTSNPTEAERAAAVWEDELREKRYHAPDRITWEAFRLRYEEDHLSTLSDGSFSRSGMAFNHLEKFIAPQLLSQVTTAELIRFQSKLRAAGLADSTIEVDMASIKAAIRWAHSVELLRVLPQFPKVRRTKGRKLMKGRPLTDSEFKKLIAAVPKVVTEDAVPPWRRFLNGLWLSGLRLEESIDFWWDRDDRLSVDFSGRRPMLKVVAEGEKGGRDRLLPMTPDFAEFLQKTPKRSRHGLVFELPRARRRDGEIPTKTWVSRTIADIGRKAGVVVDSRTGKFASAHDLRRSFGTRWAELVMPAILQRLMRHSSVETTMQYYVRIDANDVADTIYKAAKGLRKR